MIVQCLAEAATATLSDNNNNGNAHVSGEDLGGCG